MEKEINVMTKTIGIDKKGNFRYCYKYPNEECDCLEHRKFKETSAEFMKRTKDLREELKTT